MARYGKPRSLNLVSLLVYGALAAGVYGAVFFGPPYYRSYLVREVLGDAASRLILRPGQDSYDLRYQTEQRARATGITDPSVRVRFEVTTEGVTAIADYHEIVRHPLINRTTRVHFQPSVTRAKSRRLP